MITKNRQSVVSKTVVIEFDNGYSITLNAGVEEFEKWAKENRINTMKNPRGEGYYYTKTQLLWECWQAAQHHAHLTGELCPACGGVGGRHYMDCLTMLD